MIPLTTRSCQPTPAEDFTKSSWQQALAQAIRQPETLLTELGLTPAQIPSGIDTANPFPMRVPRGYVARMRPGDPHDPLLLQVLPRHLESTPQPGFLLDPVGDDAATASPGLLQKYAGRVLLVTTGACPIHCRYCFRRHYPYADNQPEDRAWTEAINHIAADKSINEVILSGGDPLSLSNERLAEISSALSHIPHIRRLRIHTRMPIVLPERVESGLLDWLGQLPWQTVLVTHCNHANEIDDSVRRAMADLKQAQVTLLNQSVLLKGVNSQVNTLGTLSETLFEAGIMPYYLHMLDRVLGAAHFEVDEATAVRLIKELQARLPGYLVPRLVREIAGEACKTPVTS
jgi:EF-P beta-lysylation protein EpmB